MIIEAYLKMGCLPKISEDVQKLTVKKSLNEFHWTVLSMSDLSDHKDSLSSQWKSRDLEMLPTNFWQFN